MKVIASNKKARFDFEILEEIEAGIILTGPEVKSLRQARVSFKNSYALIMEDKVVLKYLHISPYKFADNRGYDETRERILLLNKKEIVKLENKLNTAGLTLVPLSLYFKKGLVKVLLGLVRGRKSHDKRAVLKERTQNLEAKKALKYY